MSTTPSRKTLIGCAAVAAAAAGLMLAPAAALGAAGQSGASPAHDRAQVKTNLKNLAVAEETYLTDHDRYTFSLRHAESEGYRPGPDTTVHVVWIDGTRGYCLSGHHDGDRAHSRASYDSLTGGLKGEAFRCAAHRPPGAKG